MICIHCRQPLAHDGRWWVADDGSAQCATSQEGPADDLGNVPHEPSVEDARAVVTAWLDDDEALRIPDTAWGRTLYDALRDLAAASRAVPSDHTATTEDALDSLPYFTFEDDEVAPDEEFLRKSDVARLLATALPDTTEAQAQALEAAADEGSREWLGFKSSWGSNPTDVQTINFAVWVGKWLRERAAAIREGVE